jgi:uncharacterized membrane protein YgaE (UPF0421/DUF939 family)
MKQTHGFGKEVKRRVETDSETIDEMFDETDNKRNEKDDLEPVMSTENHGLYQKHCLRGKMRKLFRLLRTMLKMMENLKVKILQIKKPTKKC